MKKILVVSPTHREFSQYINSLNALNKDDSVQYYFAPTLDHMRGWRGAKVLFTDNAYRLKEYYEMKQYAEIIENY